MRLCAPLWRPPTRYRRPGKRSPRAAAPLLHCHKPPLEFPSMAVRWRRRRRLLPLPLFLLLTTFIPAPFSTSSSVAPGGACYQPTIAESALFPRQPSLWACLASRKPPAVVAPVHPHPPTVVSHDRLETLSCSLFYSKRTGLLIFLCGVPCVIS